MAFATGSTTSQEVEDLVPEAEGSLVLLASKSSSDRFGLDAGQHMTIRHKGKPDNEERSPAGLNDEDLDDRDYHLQLSQGCTRIVEVQQMSCELAKNVLDYPALNPTWSWDPNHGSPAVEGRRDSAAKANTDSRHQFEIHSKPLNPNVDTPAVEVEERPNRHKDLQDQSTHYQNYEDDRSPHEHRNSSDFDNVTSRTVSPIERMADDSSASTLLSPEVQYSYEAEPIVDHEEVSYSQWDIPLNSKQVSISPTQTPPLVFPSASPPPEEESVLAKLEALLFRKTEEDEKSFEKSKFNRLEQLLRSQQEARALKEAEKKKAAEAAAQAAVEAKKRADEDKLEKLEKLILAQKNEQLKREAAADAARAAIKAEADAKVAKKLELARKLNARILFEDAIGRKFSCPWQLCNTWKVTHLYNATSHVFN